MIGLVSCSSQKLDRPAPARKLYCSPMFRRSLAYAEARCERVYVLSAALGLVELSQRVEPYDLRIGGKKERAAWGRRVAGTLIDRHGREVDYLVLAGADYAVPLATALRTYDGHNGERWTGVATERILQPLAKMQVGQRLRWLNEQLARSAALTADAITDKQIRALLDDQDPTSPRLSITDRAWCIAALRIPVGRLAEVKRRAARERCAEIINARSAA